MNRGYRLGTSATSIFYLLPSLTKSLLSRFPALKSIKFQTSFSLTGTQTQKCLRFNSISNQDPPIRKGLRLWVPTGRPLVDLLLIGLHHHHIILGEDQCQAVLQWGVHPNEAHLPWVPLTKWDIPNKT